MIKKIKFYHICIALISLSLFSCKNENKKMPSASYSMSIPTAGNSWVLNNAKMDQQVISDGGIKKWDSEKAVIRTYFKTSKTGDISIGLKAKTAQASTIKITMGNTSKQVSLDNTSFKTIDAGTFNIDTAGYQYIDIEGIEKNGATFADISEVLIGGNAVSDSITYVPDDFYFGRRGPSVHLKYETPTDKDILYLYNEITVPKNEDVIGSYYMATGFGEGYFGMQVNSETERRVLFSVWSEFDTQDPNQIPKEYQVNLLGKGDAVHAGKFGNEGSGAQSYLVKNWKADTTYKFLLKVSPSVNASTDYTAYFFDPELNDWELIASFRRPKTTTYATNMHSFLENFSPSMGYITRQVQFGNQWVYTKDKEWVEITKAKFTYDATASKGARLDYAGGVSANHNFILKNCGFFNESTTFNTVLERQPTQKTPVINFNTLEKPSLNN